MNYFEANAFTSPCPECGADVVEVRGRAYVGRGEPYDHTMTGGRVARVRDAVRHDCRRDRPAEPEGQEEA